MDWYLVGLHALCIPIGILIYENEKLRLRRIRLEKRLQKIQEDSKMMKCSRCKKRDAEILLHSNGTLSEVTGWEDQQIPLCSDPLCIRITVYNMIGLMMNDEDVEKLLEKARSSQEESLRKVQEILGLPYEIHYSGEN